MTTTGKALLFDAEDIIAITSFSTDRTCDELIWLRYVSTRDDLQASGIGPRFLRTVATTLHDSAKSIRIAVNNPYAYVAGYKAGFVYTQEQTGIAELVLEYPGVRTNESYTTGLEIFQTADHLSPDEKLFVKEKLSTPPPPVDLRHFHISD